MTIENELQTVPLPGWSPLLIGPTLFQHSPLRLHSRLAHLFCNAPLCAPSRSCPDVDELILRYWKNGAQCQLRRRCGRTPCASGVRSLLCHPWRPYVRDARTGGIGSHHSPGVESIRKVKSACVLLCLLSDSRQDETQGVVSCSQLPSRAVFLLRI